MTSDSYTGLLYEIERKSWKHIKKLLLSNSQMSSSFSIAFSIAGFKRGKKMTSFTLSIGKCSNSRDLSRKRKMQLKLSFERIIMILRSCLITIEQYQEKYTRFRMKNL